MSHAPLRSSCCEFDADTAAVYQRVLDILNESGLPFLVGGAYAFSCFTGIERVTKDLDLFIRRSDFEEAARVITRADPTFKVELTYPHWLGKIWAGEVFIDLIFNSGNGVTEVDEDWFTHAADGEVLGRPVKLSPIEEQIWSKAFIMERERHDGADVAHLLHACARQIDWPRLLQRFGPHWRVLMSHLVLFGFIYPAERDELPAWVMTELLQRLNQEIRQPPPDDKLCAGTLLSREQYLDDVSQAGYRDGRVAPFGSMSPEDVARWTDAIPDRTSRHAD